MQTARSACGSTLAMGSMPAQIHDAARYLSQKMLAFVVAIVLAFGNARKGGDKARSLGSKCSNTQARFEFTLTLPTHTLKTHSMLLESDVRLRDVGKLRVDHERTRAAICEDIYTKQPKSIWDNMKGQRR